jgi:flagellar basal-body rod protein FlgB
MAITDVPLLGMLTQRMKYAHARQTQIAQNVANADLPGYVPKDIKTPDLKKNPLGFAGVSTTNAQHLMLTGSVGSAETSKGEVFETRPSGNAVVLEDEMRKMGETQIDYQMVAGLYQKSLQLFRLALGRNS